ncbi:ribosome hibernation-promoting factor, HPF/YfiA family [Marinibaculum pumilum]|uniref:Ribosome hibernation promoting factor n=1 Tax=Marinibaculum pumilum TaxID=1766165 RepID=A0ABV7L720_9PROT
MKVTVTGRHIDLGDALREHVDGRLQNGVAKYFDKAIEAQVVVRKEGPLYHTEISVHVGSDIDHQSKAEDADIYASVDQAAARMEKQLRRDKRKRRNHHAGPASPDLR